jgi:GNAT superfamily N-acetyltransferase
MKITVRAAKKTDVPAIYDLVKQLAEFEKSPGAVINTVDAMIKDGFGKDKIFYSFVAETDNKIIGMAVFYFAYSTWKGKHVYLDDLIVNEKYRRSGAGKILFDAVYQFAKEHNASQLRWHVLDWNEPAINFYKKYPVTFDPTWITCKIEKENL